MGPLLMIKFLYEAKLMEKDKGIWQKVEHTVPLNHIMLFQFLLYICVEKSEV